MFEVNGNFIRNRLLKSGISISQFSKESGLNPFTVRKALNGKQLNVKSISAIAKYFGVEPDELLKGDND